MRIETLVWGPALFSPTTKGENVRTFQMVWGMVNWEGIVKFLYLLAGSLGGGSFAEEPTVAWGSHIMAALS